MRVQVEYDDDGRIISVSGAASGESAGPGGQVGRVFNRSHHVIEVEAEEMRHERDFDGLRRFVSGHSVEGHPDAPRLVTSATAQ
jgi:hypothetical protein